MPLDQLKIQRQKAELDKRYWQALALHADHLPIQEMTLNEDFTFIHITDLSLTVHALMGHTEATALDMTHLFQLTYLSNQLHLHIQDESEGQAYNEQLKLELLTGDYLFGQALQGLLTGGHHRLIAQYTHMLAEINTGLVMKHRLEAPDEEVLRRTKGVVYGMIFYTAACLADKENDWQQRFTDFGAQLGMALELTQLQEERARFYWEAMLKSWVALRLHESPGAAAWQRWWKWVRAKQKFAAR